MKLATITVPIYKANLSNDEKASLLQLFKTLGSYSINLFTYRELNFTYYEKLLKNYNYSITYFKKDYFKSLSGYNRLLLSALFYENFLDFKFILIYQLDAWVFSDQLTNWCNADFDYIGAPWFSSDRPPSGLPHFRGIGNGGFSLRKVKSHIKVLNNFNYIISPRYYLGQFLNSPTFRTFQNLLLNLTINNNTHSLLGKNELNEDIFWSLVINKFDWFKAPEMIEASTFSTEFCAKKLYEINNDVLPFGCHGWDKYEVDFWSRFIK